MSKSYNFDIICRICLGEDVKSLISIFSHQTIQINSLQLSEMLVEIASIQVSQNDSLPKVICNMCAEQLKNSYQFKQLCQKSERELLKIIEENQICKNSTNEVFIKKEIKNEIENYLDENTNNDINYSFENNSFKNETLSSDDEPLIKRVKVLDKFKKTAKIQKYSSKKHQNGCFVRKKKIKTVNEYQSHSDEGYNCNLCFEPFTTESALNKHNTSQHCVCKICFKVFHAPQDLETHLKLTHENDSNSSSNNEVNDDKDYKTDSDNDYTDNCTENEKWLDEQNPTQKKSRTRDCKICGESFTKTEDFAIHMTIHVGSQFQCNICQRYFTSNSALKRHEMCHYPSCRVCMMKFETKTELIKHKEEHKDHLPFVCKDCGKQFLKRKLLISHMKRHNGGPEEKNHLCTVCGRAFTLLCNLETHFRIHTGERPYVCKICNKGFAQWSSLRSHMVNHSDERSFVCQTCGKTFLRKGTLVEHIKTHTGERNYPCTYCDKRFSNSTRLKVHTVVHTGEKNFKCETCGKAFNRKSTLRTHNKIHTGERPHRCSVCGTAFIQRHVLISHMNTHK